MSIHPQLQERRRLKRICQRIAAIAALPLVLATCGQGDSGNVMAPAANLLSPEQVDAALGPEPANGANALEAPNVDNVAEPVEAADAVEESIEPQVRSEPEPDPVPEPVEEPAEVEPADNNVVEE